MLIVQILFLCCFFYLAYYFAHLLFFTISGLFYKGVPAAGNENLQARKTLVLVPAYKEDVVILQTARQAIEQDYPSDKFEVWVIADSLKQETIQKLREVPVRVVEVKFEKSLKSKSLNVALNQAKGQAFQSVVILDADNLITPGCLTLFNRALHYYQAVQGHRVPKNLTTGTATLDGMTEEINNHIFRKGYRFAGLSSALSGSGMAFHFDLFTEIMSGVESTVEDRYLEMHLLERKIITHYEDDARVLDEKVTEVSSMKNQRSRWIAGHLEALKLYGKKAPGQLLKGNFDFFMKFIQLTMVPRSILMALAFLTFVLALITLNPLNIILWIGVMLGIFTSMFFCLPSELRGSKALKAFASMPGAVFGVLSNGKRWIKTTEFYHTPHGSVAEDTEKNNS
ncbi:glycosyltransferase family 2 protein [Roseivirga sp. BDSF3-8]|uniref:glycosyltransferase n=1 Tax=Roseivirga sp. BDSF3-8 TaxID=3241598 RepID=UPI0035318DD7